ncbi:MAG TPA: hypothetical protein VHF22_13555 [Planctomycetota bacterium]|nr:hypothetical protein [Planctomycetota bacterium]
MDDLEIKSQAERLEAARRDPDLLGAIPRVVAAQFGVVPLKRLAGGGLEVAIVPSHAPAAVRGLERALRRKVVACPFDEGLVQLYLSRVYLRDETMNFNTFGTADFLERDEDLALLLLQKPMRPVEPHLRADPASLVVLDYAYRSTLEPLDARGFPVAFDEDAATDLPFVLPPEPATNRESDEPEPPVTISRDVDLPASVAILARESFSCGGAEHRHGWRRHEISELPFMIHPSELQVTGLEPDGALDLFIYDHVERVRPGDAPRYEITYHFLSMGQRLRRHLILKIYSLSVVPRSAVARTGDALPWQPRHFQRWLGYDL